MTKLPLIAATLVIAALGLAAPALAASATSGNVPYCPTGTDLDYSSRAGSLATQLQLSTKLNTTISQWNGCLRVTTVADGKAIMRFYDPDSFKLVAEIG